jgi:hypothetical protein
MHRVARRGRIFDLLTLLLLLGAGLLAAQLAYRAPGRASFAIDAPPVMLPLAGFHELERFTDRDGLFRWTQGGARIELPNPGGRVAAQLQLAGGSGRSVTAQLGQGAFGLALDVQPAPRIYRVLLPPASGERLQLTLDSSTVREGRRDLGVVVGNLGVTPWSTTSAAPAQVILALLAASGAAYLLARQAGVGRGQSAGIGLLVQALVALWLAAGGWRYALAGQLLLAASGAALAAVVAERWLRSRDQGSGIGEIETPAPSPQPLAPNYTLLALVIVAALALRLPWLIAPDPVGDLELSARRLGQLYNAGWAGAYTFNGDYMPLRLLVLRGLSQLVPPLGGVFRADPPSATLLLIKLPGLLSDLATIGLLYAWSRRSSSERAALGIVALYTLAPPVWINVAWWGQVDAFLMLPMLLTITLLDRAGGRWSWLAWAVALLIKPQAIIIAPLLFVATLRRHGTRGLLEGGALAVGLIALGCLPLTLAGQGPGLMQAYLGSVGRFPKLTNGAWNLWYLVTGGVDTLDFGQGIGPLSFHLLGFALLGVVVLLVCLSLWLTPERDDGPLRAEGAAVLALAFFLLPTEIHERYAFLPLAFLALRLSSAPRLIWPYLALVCTATLNILGELSGFAPPVYAYLSRSSLPLVLAALNLAVLIGLLGHLLHSSLGRAVWLRPRSGRVAAEQRRASSADRAA